jgi:multicomponent Na+:H+ antiporter subunit B
MVAAVNFDVRGFDTLGEECILIAAVSGTCVLLRGSRGEKLTDKAGRLPGRAIVSRSDATIMVCRLAAALTLVFGAYMVLHGTVTPGCQSACKFGSDSLLMQFEGFLAF